MARQQKGAGALGYERIGGRSPKPQLPRRFVGLCDDVSLAMRGEVKREALTTTSGRADLDSAAFDCRVAVAAV
jgi:hypothetical protein